MAPELPARASRKGMASFLRGSKTKKKKVMGDQSDGDKRAGVEDKNLLQYDCLHSNMSHGQTKKVRSVCGLVVESVTER